MDIISTFWFEAILKLFLGFILAGIIGSQRESANKPAGFKTHSLIGISSVLIMLCGEYLSKEFNTDVSRIPAQLLSGIGFIGAGTILRDGFNVKGLTTAASLLAVTCIGLSIGAGFYIGGIVCTIFVYSILISSHNISNKFDHLFTASFNIEILPNTNISDLIQEILTNNEITIKKIKRTSSGDNIVFEITCKYKNENTNISKVISEISSLDGVLETEEI